MMEQVISRAAEQGYSPDFCITPDQTLKGRPYPYMIRQNLMEFGIAEPREAIKVGDTTSDIEEGKNANCWTVGVIMGSSELGLSRENVATLSQKELNVRKDAVRKAYNKAGADYVIDDFDQLLDVIDALNK